MQGRAIVTHGGGELEFGGGPPIDGVIHGWIYEEGMRGRGGPYGFMLGHREARRLVEALRSRETVEVKTFTGHLTVGHSNDLAHLRFFTWGERLPEKVCRLYDGSIYAAADALGELCEEAEGSVLPLRRVA